MKILFITGYGYLPQLFGGLQSYTDQLCLNLQKKGYEVVVLARFLDKGMLGLTGKFQRVLYKRSASRDAVNGYPVWRAWYPSEAVDYVVRYENPDIVVAMSGEFVKTALKVKAVDVPVILQMHDVEFDRHGGDFRDLGAIRGIANSNFTAEKYREAYGIDAKVIYPLISLERCKTITTRENVTFINPSAPKGFELALEIARLCPEIPFSFVETWTSPLQRREVLQKIVTFPNVTLSPPQKIMLKVYSKCKILLVPSKWEETYGMVTTEAQVNGIPVIASARGGLPEAVGTGGILLDPDAPAEIWAQALRRLWLDDNYYSIMSEAAITHSQRPEMLPDYQMREWENIISTEVGNRNIRQTKLRTNPKITAMSSTNDLDTNARNFSDVNSRMSMLDSNLDVYASLFAGKLLLLDYPVHGNIGDLMIWMGEQIFFRRHKKKLIGQYSIYNIGNKARRLLDECSTICFHGGGNFGDLWPQHHKLREQIIAEYRQKRIVILPQTVYFENLREMGRSCDIMREHPDLHILVRDRRSLGLLKDQRLPNVQLCPDMAHALWQTISTSNPTISSPLYLLRRDKEDSFLPPEISAHRETSIDWSDLINGWTKHIYQRGIWIHQLDGRRKVDNFLPAKNIWSIISRMLINRGVDLFAPYETIVTNRLHAVILALLLRKQVSVFDNSYGKISSYLDCWLQGTSTLNFYKE